MYISETKLLQYALYSNAIYVFLFFLFRPDGITPQKIIISGFLLFSVVAVFVYCYRNRRLINEIPLLAKRLLYILLFWSIVVVVRSFSTNIQDWVTNFGNVYMALAWFTPILIVVGQKIENWKVVFKTIFFMFQLMLMATLVLPFYFYGGILQTEWVWLLRPVNFITLVGLVRFNVVKRFSVYLIYILYLIIAVLLEQRIEFIFLTLVIMLLFIDKLRQVKLKKQVLKHITIGFVLLLILVFTYGYENISSLISNLIDFQDSRSFLFKELLSDLNAKEIYLGRGSLGTYYSDFFERTRRYYEFTGKTGWPGDVPIRITTEVGYLQMILKGGFLMVFLNVYLMLYSIYLGVFKSKSGFIKRLGIYILVILILSLISFRPAFTPTFIILWVSIGTVLNKKNRMMTNEEIKKIISF